MSITVSKKDLQSLVDFQKEVLANYGVTLEHVGCLLLMTKEERDALVVERKERDALATREVVAGTAHSTQVVAPHTLSGKFDMLADLGVITVPENHTNKAEFFMIHETGGEVHRSHTAYVDSIPAGAFLNPNRILKAGDKLHARVFQKIDTTVTTTEELFELFTKEKAVYIGLQGATLVLEQKRKLLPIGFACVSFEKEINLWLPEVISPVPYVEALSNEEYVTDTVDFSFVCQDRTSTFLVFTDLPAVATAKEKVSEVAFLLEEPLFPEGSR